MMRLRRVLTGQRFALAALVLVMAAQIAALNHLIGHTARGDNAGCAICVSASHAGNAVPASAATIHVLPSADPPAPFEATRQVAVPPPAAYHSRAPPRFA